MLNWPCVPVCPSVCLYILVSPEDVNCCSLCNQTFCCCLCVCKCMCIFGLDTYKKRKCSVLCSYAKNPHISQVNVHVSVKFHSFVKSRFGVFSCAFSPAGVCVFCLFSRK